MCIAHVAGQVVAIVACQTWLSGLRLVVSQTVGYRTRLAHSGAQVVRWGAAEARERGGRAGGGGVARAIGDLAQTEQTIGGKQGARVTGGAPIKTDAVSGTARDVRVDSRYARVSRDSEFGAALLTLHSRGCAVVSKTIVNGCRVQNTRDGAAEVVPRGALEAVGRSWVTDTVLNWGFWNFGAEILGIKVVPWDARGADAGGAEGGAVGGAEALADLGDEEVTFGSKGSSHDVDVVLLRRGVQVEVVRDEVVLVEGWAGGAGVTKCVRVLETEPVGGFVLAAQLVDRQDLVWEAARALVAGEVGVRETVGDGRGDAFAGLGGRAQVVPGGADRALGLAFLVRAVCDLDRDADTVACVDEETRFTDHASDCWPADEGVHEGAVGFWHYETGLACLKNVLVLEITD